MTQCQKSIFCSNIRTLFFNWYRQSSIYVSPISVVLVWLRYWIATRISIYVTKSGTYLGISDVYSIEFFSKIRHFCLVLDIRQFLYTLYFGWNQSRRISWTTCIFLSSFQRSKYVWNDVTFKLKTYCSIKRMKYETHLLFSFIDW